MVTMKFDPDFGYIAVDAAGNLHDAANAAIQAERELRGIDVRDPGMMYRPTVTTTPGATPDQAATYSAGFGQIADPIITLANLAKDPGALRRETGQVNNAAIQLIQSIQEAAQNRDQHPVDPLAAALAQQGLTPYYEEEEPQGPQNLEGDLTIADGVQYRFTNGTWVKVEESGANGNGANGNGANGNGPQEGDLRTDENGVQYRFTNGAWTQVEAAPAAGTTNTPGFVEAWNNIVRGNVTSLAEIEEILSTGGFTPEELGQLAEQGAVSLMNNAPPGSDMGVVQMNMESLWNKFVAPHSGAQPEQFTGWLEGMGWTPIDSTTSQDAGRVSFEVGPSGPGTGQLDLGGYWSKLFEGTFGEGGSLGGSWEQKVNQIATALYKNPNLWAEIPGMAGLDPADFNLHSIKQWLTDTAWGSISEEERNRLTTTYGGDSEPPGVYTIQAAPSSTAAPGTVVTGTQPPGAQPPGTQPPGAQPPGTQPPGTQPSLFGVPMPTPGQTPAQPKTEEDMLKALGMFLDPAGERSFSEIYPGFAASQAGYGLPTVQQAYQQAAAPLQTQYGLQLPELLRRTAGADSVADILGSGMNYLSPKDWLESLASGTGRVLGGADLFGRLQDVGRALSIDPLMQTGMSAEDQMKSSMWRSLFEKPSQQVSAFAQPFLMATRGAPEARKALTDAISRAGAQFQYQNPLGVEGQGFLPWALGQNLLGIKGMFTPGSAKQNPGWVPGGDKPLASAPGVFSQPFWQSAAGKERQEWDTDIGI